MMGLVSLSSPNMGVVVATLRRIHGIADHFTCAFTFELRCTAWRRCRAGDRLVTRVQAVGRVERARRQVYVAS